MKTGLILVDIQNDYFPGGAMELVGIREAVTKAKELLQQTDRIIATFPEVERVFGKSGRAETATDPAPLTMLETTIMLKPRGQWRPGLTPDMLIDSLDAAVQFPGLTNSWTMPIRTRIDMLATGIKTPVGIKVAGPDLAEIERIDKQAIDDALGGLPATSRHAAALCLDAVAALLRTVAGSESAQLPK